MPIRHPRLAATIAVTAGIALLAGCASPAPTAADSTEPAAAETTPIRIALTTGTVSVAIADAEGFFADHGLDVEVTELATGTETIAAVQGGSADVAYADTFAGAGAISNGFDVVLVAGANNTSPAVSYLVRADSVIETPEGLAGHNIGIGGVPFFRVFANNFLDAADVSPDDVQFTVVRQSAALPEALQAGTVDAIQSLGYQVAYLNDGIGEGYDFRSIGDPDTSAYQDPNAQQAGWWSAGAWAEENEDTVQAFADAYRDFAAWYNDLGVEERSDLALEYSDVDYRAIAGDDEEKLENLALYTVARYIAEPVDIEATQEWIDDGARIAPEQVPSGVTLDDHVFVTAR